MLEQLGVWYCKATSLAAASHKKEHSSCSSESPRKKPVQVGVDELNCGESNYAWQLSRFNLGKMLHMVTDSFSRSHVRRHFCPGASLDMEVATGDCIAVDPGDAHDEAVKVWNKYRNKESDDGDAAPAPEPDPEPAPESAPEPAPEQDSFLQRKNSGKKTGQPIEYDERAIHTVLHQRHGRKHKKEKKEEKEKEKKDEVEGYMDAPEEMKDVKLPEKKEEKDFTVEDDEVALRSAKIQQFYSMDDTDWPKHGSSDSVQDDWRFDLAGAATRLVIREFIRFVKLTDSTAVDDVASDKELQTQSLHKLLRLACDDIFPFDEETGKKGAGGSDSRLALNKKTWYPYDTLSVDDAKAYFKARGVLLDFPLGQGDVCELVDFADYHRTIGNSGAGGRGDMELPPNQTSLGFASCDALISEPITLFTPEEEAEESGCAQLHMSLLIALGLFVTVTPNI